MWTWLSNTLSNFNSHPHEEDDEIGTFTINAMLDISTHILTKRMTIATITRPAFTIFQLTSSRRGWPSRIWEWLLDTIFQLTSSRRGWRCKRHSKRTEQHFNSHPHEEDDHLPLSLRMKKDYFNSHPHEEDDFHGYCKWMYLYISTHILTKRMTEHVVSIWNTTKHFNSHPHEEDDSNFKQK